MQLHQKKYLRIKLKEKNIFMEKSIVKYEKINSEFMLVFYLIAGLHKGCGNGQSGWVRLVKQTIQ
jgi:hypothetical protein